MIYKVGLIFPRLCKTFALLSKEFVGVHIFRKDDSRRREYLLISSFCVFSVLTNNQRHCKISSMHCIFYKNSNIRQKQRCTGNNKGLSLRSGHLYIYVYSQFFTKSLSFLFFAKFFTTIIQKFEVAFNNQLVFFDIVSVVFSLPKKEGLPFFVHISRNVCPCYLANRQALWTWMWWDRSTTPSNVEFTQTQLSESHFSLVNERCTDCSQEIPMTFFFRFDRNLIWSLTNKLCLALCLPYCIHYSDIQMGVQEGAPRDSRMFVNVS